jgi:HEAT repeat protein
VHVLMRAFLRNFFGLLFWVAVLLCVALGCGKANIGVPSYRGRALSEWVDELGNPKFQGADRQKAVLAVQSSGTNALPFLIAQIGSGHTIDGPRRAGIVAALEALGKDAESALPALVEVAVQGDERSSETALWALSRMGNPGVEAMTNAIAMSNGSRRLKVVEMLHSMGTNAHSAVPAVLLCLRNTEGDYDTAYWAGCAAARASLQPREVIRDLTTNLLEGGSACRYGSASGLRLFGSEAKAAVPALKALLSDTNERVRYAASNALSTIQQ